MTEIWRQVRGFEGAYEISNEGRLRAISRRVWFTSKKGRRCLREKVGRLVATPVGNHGYPMAYLTLNEERRAATLHSLVAEAFIGPRPEGMEVCHNDGNRQNCAAWNLRYDTRKNNHKDKDRHGTKARGSAIRQSKLLETDIPYIRACQGQLPVLDVADHFGVTRRTIERIWHRQAWVHVL